MLKQKYWMAIVLASLFIGGSLVLTQTYSAGVGVYNPWADINDDGKVNILDCIQMANTFGTNGPIITKASVEYDSGWIDIADKQGQDIIITHDLNLPNWNDEKLMVDITGKTTLDGELHRTLGLYQALGWNKTLGGMGEGGFLYWGDMLQAADGGYVIASHTSSYGGSQLLLFKTDSLGGVLWNKTYGGDGDDAGFALVQTNDGGYAIAGATVPAGAIECDAWLVKTDANGDMQWNQTYGTTEFGEYAYALVQMTDGGYALIAHASVEDYDFWLVKTDSEGNALWNMTYGGTGSELPSDLVQTTDGGYAITGDTSSYGAGSTDFWLVKTDANGNTQWNRTYGGTGSDQPCALMQTTDSGYALAGHTTSFGAGSSDLWLVKTDASGNELWNKTYGGTGAEEARALIQTTDGGYTLAGFTRSLGAGSGDFWLVKTDKSGDVQWNMTYGESHLEVAWALVPTSDRGYALFGLKYYVDADDSDFWLIKTDQYGNDQSGEFGLAWIDQTAGTITLHRGAQDPLWNYVRVRILKQKQTP